MARWGFWDWIGYAVLGVAAIIEALNTSLKAAPELSAALPKIFSGELVGYLPLAFFTLATVILLLRLFNLLPGRRKTNPAPSESTTSKTFADLELVEKKRFERESVVIDGKKFLDCQFNEVKLIYNGDLFSFQHCRFGSHLTIASDKDSFTTFITLLYELGFVAAPVKDQDGNVVQRNTIGGPEQSADAHPPEAGGIYEGAHERLMLFVIDALFPVCGARSRLHGLIINALCANAPVAELARIGAAHHSNARQFTEGRDSLEELGTSPPTFIPFPRMIESVWLMERGYKSYLLEADRIAQTGYMHPKSKDAIAKAWEEWRVAHNAMVKAYESIKRDSKMGKLFRPYRESLWGGEVQPPPAGEIPLHLLLREPEQ